MDRQRKQYHFFVICQHISLDNSVSLIYDMDVGTKKLANTMTSKRLAMLRLGLREGSSRYRLAICGRGFNSPQVQCAPVAQLVEHPAVNRGRCQFKSGQAR